MVDPWVGRGACRAQDVDPEWFFPGPGKEGINQTRLALAVCKQCPVLNACARWTVESDAQASLAMIHGIQGGMVESTRHKILRSVRQSREDAQRLRRLVVSAQW